MSVNPNERAFDEIERLKDEIATLRKINLALMKRVERSIDSSGNAFSLFENNILLQRLVHDRTVDLERSNRLLSVEIAERKQAEERLRESERNTRLIIENALDAIVIFNSDWTILDWNPRAETTFGYTFDEAVGALTLEDILPNCAIGQLSQSLTQHAEPFASQPGGTACELAAVNRSGRHFPVELSLSPIPATNGTLYAAFIRDITERKQAEEARYRSLFENSPISLWVKDLSAVKIEVDKLLAGGVSDLRNYLETQPEVTARLMSVMQIVDVNRVTLSLFGAADKTQFLADVGRIFDARAMTVFIDEITAMLSGRREFTCEVGSSTLAGEPIDLVLYMNLPPGYEESWGKVFVSLIDVTGRHRAEEEKAHLEEQLRHAQKLEMVGTLAGGIAHDFNNLLSPILGYTNMILDSMQTTHGMREALEQVVTAGNRARDLVRQILTFSRRMENERAPVELNYVVKEALDLLRASLPSTVDLVHETGGGMHMVIADATQIHQVVMNFCTNAFQALPGQAGRIHVRLDNVELESEFIDLYPALHAGPYVRLAVSDNGTGMDRETRSRIFEPFFTTKPVGEGTGMGLAVTHGIVAAHGGEIVVESEPGVGSTFTLYLPAAEMTAVCQERAVCEVSRGSGNIMVIDDDPIVSELTTQMLEMLGYHVNVFGTCAAALAAFKEAPARFDAVVTDQTMPQMTGVQLAAALLKLRPELPIVLLTGYSEVVTEQNYRDFGISELVFKPCGMAEISQAVRRALSPEIA